MWGCDLQELDKCQSHRRTKYVPIGQCIRDIAERQAGELAKALADVADVLRSKVLGGLDLSIMKRQFTSLDGKP